MLSNTSVDLTWIDDPLVMKCDDIQRTLSLATTGLMPVTAQRKRYAETLSPSSPAFHLLQRFHSTIKGISRVSILYKRSEGRRMDIKIYNTDSPYPSLFTFFSHLTAPVSSLFLPDSAAPLPSAARPFPQPHLRHPHPLAPGSQV